MELGHNGQPEKYFPMPLYVPFNEVIVKHYCGKWYSRKKEKTKKQINISAAITNQNTVKTLQYIVSILRAHSYAPDDLYIP